REEGLAAAVRGFGVRGAGGNKGSSRPERGFVQGSRAANRREEEGGGSRIGGAPSQAAGKDGSAQEDDRRASHPQAALWRRCRGKAGGRKKEAFADADRRC